MNSRGLSPRGRDRPTLEGVPDDVGQPFADGEGPDSQDRAAADEVFAAVVLDDDFVEAAEIHEPTAAERILYAALERAESEAAEEPRLYHDPDLDVSLPAGLPVFEDSPDEGPDEEGRFDRSDYTRYLPDDDDDDTSYHSYVSYSPVSPRRGGADAFLGERRSVPQRVPSSWRPMRWQRPVACVLAMVMGVSVIAFVLIAIQRGGSSGSGSPSPGWGTSDVEAEPSAGADP